MRTTLARVASVSLSATAAVGLAACGSNSAPSVSPASSTSTSSAPSSTSSSSSSSSSSEPSDTSTSSSSSSSSGSSVKASGPLPTGCGTTLSGKTADLKIGQPAVYKDTSKGATVCMTVKKLAIAPDSVYQGSLTKANGPVYFLTVNYANVGGETKAVHASDINQLELHPVVASGQKGKTYYGSVPGCEHNEDYNDIPAGKSQDTCIIYQISGPKSTSVVYNDYTNNYTWK